MSDDLFLDTQKNDSKALSRWILDQYQPVDKELKTVLEQTKQAGFPPIQVDPMDDRLIEVICRIVQPEKILEIGTLTGYSSICLSRGLKEKGHLWTIEKNEAHAQLARDHFKQFGLSEKITLLEGSALELISDLQSNAPFDLVFIDADKKKYPQYLDLSIKLLRTGGVIIADDTLGFGQIHLSDFKSKKEKDTIGGIQSFHKKACLSQNLRSAFIPTASGMSVFVKI